MVTPNLFQPVLTPKAGGVTSIWKVLGSKKFLDSLQFSFTFNFDPIDFSDVSMLVLEIDAQSTQNVNLLITVNGITNAVYFQDGSSIDTFPPTETIIDINNANDFTIGSGIFQSSRSVSLLIYFQLNSNRLSVQLNANRQSALSGGLSYKTTGKINQDITSVSSIKLETNNPLRFFKIGSRMSLYSVSR